MKKFAINIFIIILGMLFGSVITSHYYTRQQSVKIGKQIGYNISEELTYSDIEAAFGSWDEEKEKTKLSNFLRDNNLVVLPGQYRINQSAKFEDVIFILKFGVNSKEF